MNALEQLSMELKTVTAGLQSDLEAWRKETKSGPSQVGTSPNRKDGPGNGTGNGRLAEFDAAAAKSGVVWRRPGAAIPALNRTVLVYATNAQEPVWLGYHDGCCWRAVDGTRLNQVELWGEIPHPEEICQRAEQAACPT